MASYILEKGGLLITEENKVDELSKKRDSEDVMNVRIARIAGFHERWGLDRKFFSSSILAHPKSRCLDLKEPEPPSFSDIGRVSTYLGFLILFYLLFEPLGYLLTIFLFIAFVLKFLTQRSLKFSISISALIALFVFLVFVNLLGVTMPEGILKYIF